MRDSRQYRFPLLIWREEDWLDDFTGPPPDFRCGVFLPRDDPDWFGRSAYSPRIVALGNDRLVVYSHESESTPPVIIALDDSFELETGHFLLLGWMRFSCARTSLKLAYNTRVSGPMELFLKELQQVAFRVRSDSDGQRLCALGDPLDLKFDRALAAELDDDERIYLRVFTKPQTPVPSRWSWVVRECDPADLLVVTDRRLLWITDRYGKRKSLYGTMVRCATHERLAELAENTGRERGVRLRFRSGEEWRIPCVLDSIRLKAIRDTFAHLMRITCES